MKIKTENLTGVALSWAVAVSMGATVRNDNDSYGTYIYFNESKFPRMIPCSLNRWNPDSDWRIVGQILESQPYHINTLPSGYRVFDFYDKHSQMGAKLPETILRLYVMVHMGDEVDVPDQILEEAI